MPRITIPPPTKPQMTYIGVDPGQKGAIAYISPRGYDSLKTPTDERSILKTMRWLAKEFPQSIAVIEQVHARPMNGSISLFKLGESFGLLKMAMRATEIQFVEEVPQVWQRGMNIRPRDKIGGESSSKFKSKLVSIAKRLFPAIKLTQQNADALLIAEYCRRRHCGIV